tara:strand:+ start:1032 stop:3137 length:2106 start_codon:yes stop_codon:yes gene_type:complete
VIAKRLRSFFSLLLLIFTIVPSLVGQYNEEDREFREYLKKHINIEELKVNPILSYSKTDSIIGNININSDSLFNARFYNLLGKLNANKGNHKIAIEYFNTANDFYGRMNPAPFFIHNSLDRGNSYYKIKDITKALEDYNEALELGIILNDQQGTSTAYNNLGLLQLQEGEMEKALSNFTNAYEIRIELQDSFLIGHSLGHIAMYEFHSGQFSSSIKTYKSALAMLKNIKDSDDRVYNEISRLHNDLGYACFKEGKPDMARKSALMSVEFAKKLSKKRPQINLLYQSARVLYFSGFYKEAIEFGQQIRFDARDNDFKDLLLKSYELLTDCYEKQGEYEKAIEYARKGHLVKERISQDQIDKRLADERFTYQTLNNKKLLQMIEKENRLKGIELDAQERISQLLTLLIIISLLGIIGLYMANKQKKKVNLKLVATNRLIEQQNLEIKKQQNALKTAKADLENKMGEMEGLTDEKTHLLSIVAHDMRTPLNSILGLCDLIEMEENEENAAKSRKQYLELLKESGNRMLGMINTLLNVRKIETQNIEVNFSSINVYSTINKVLTDFKNWSDRKSINVSISDVEITQTVYADENLFRQVLENLISNAIKYSPFKTSIEIYGELRESTYLIHIKDHGPGISQAEQSRLFGKYQRLSARPTAGEDSIGIGLSLVKKLTELMNGNVFFTSELGFGSTFSCEFSLKKPFN